MSDILGILKFNGQNCLNESLKKCESINAMSTLGEISEIRKFSTGNKFLKVCQTKH